LTIETRELQALINKLNDKSLIERVSENALYNATSSLTSESIKDKNHRWKSKTGVLGGATVFKVRGLTSEIFINEKRAPYGPAIYYGYKAFTFGPKNTQALSFVVGNERWFAKSVRHPGWKADPYILNTYNKRKKQFIKQFQGDMTRELQEAL